MKNKKVLFIHNTQASWTLRDLKILKSITKTETLFLSREGYFHPKTYYNLIRSDVLFCWFGSLNFLPILLLAKLFGKRTIIVAGGYDVACCPAVGHGTFSKSWPYRLMGRLVFWCGDKVLSVSESSKREAMKNAKVPEAKIEIVSHGFEALPHPPKPWNERRNLAVMVSNIDHNRLQVKGLDTFIKLAQATPEVNFEHVGKVAPEILYRLKVENLQNLKFHGELQYNSPQFNAVLDSAKIIMQLSRYESFGAAVVEGAIRGCLPIVSNNFALPELVNNRSGFVANNLKNLRKTLLKALNDNYESDIISKEYSQKFGLQKRREALERTLLH